MAIPKIPKESRSWAEAKGSREDGSRNKEDQTEAEAGVSRTRWVG